MQIFGPYRVSTPPSTTAAQRNSAPKPAESAKNQSSGPVDELDLTNRATSTSRIDASPEVSVGGDIRIDRVAEIRRQIADGTYETPEKLDAALDRLLDQLA